MGEAFDQEGEFAEVVVAPHAAFAAGDFLSGWDVVPTVGAMVDGVEEKALVVGVGGEVGFGEEGAEDSEAGLEVGGVLEVAAEAEKALGGDGGGGAVNGFEFVEGLGGAVEVMAEAV